MFQCLPGEVNLEVSEKLCFIYHFYKTLIAKKKKEGFRKYNVTLSKEDKVLLDGRTIKFPNSDDNINLIICKLTLKVICLEDQYSKKHFCQQRYKLRFQTNTLKSCDSFYSRTFLSPSLAFCTYLFTFKQQWEELVR